MDARWGAGIRRPVLILNPDDSTIDVQVFESDGLRGYLSRLDEFERPGYQRVVTTVHTPEVDVTSSIYVLAAAETTE